MYGTISRFKVKEGGWEVLEKSLDAQPELPSPGAMAILRMDADSDEVYAVAMAESEEAYREWSEEPEMHEAYQQRLEGMESEPEWNDGRVVVFRHRATPDGAEPYGTIAELRLKPNARRLLIETTQWDEQPEGALALWVLQMDADPNQMLLVAISESEEAYRAYSESDESHEQYLEMLEWLEGEPTWHDGRVVDYRISED